MKRARTWCELYSFPGFRAMARLKGVFGDPGVRVVRLRRKKRPGRVRAAAASGSRSTTGAWCERGIFRPAVFALSLNLNGCA
jgi:hypothetical protein